MSMVRLTLIVATVAGAVIGAPASAQVMRTFLSATGIDNGDCASTSPCASLKYAHDHTGAHGEIVILSSGDYSLATITKSITIRGNGGPISFTGAMNVQLGADDQLILTDLDMNGHGDPQSGYGAAVNGLGNGEIIITHCFFRGYGSSAVVLQPTTGSLRVTIGDSVIAQSMLAGIRVHASAGAAAHLKIVDSRLVANGGSGILAIGATSDVLMSNTEILGSPKALTLQSGAIAKSYGNNVLTNGDAPTKVPLN
jgi:hypothetical protein